MPPSPTFAPEVEKLVRAAIDGQGPLADPIRSLIRREAGHLDESGRDMATQAELDAHIADPSAAHAASAISVNSATLVGTGTDAQAVLEELDNGIADHLADTTAAHAASAISCAGSPGMAATNVEAALDELAGFLPWLIDLDVFGTSIAHTNWDTIAAAAGMIHGGWKQTTAGAQNDEIAWDVVLAAGTWTVELMYSLGSNAGIYTVSLDGTSVGTIDGYNATQVLNARNAINGIAVAATGKKRLKLKMATKHASSSAYYGLLQHVQLRRTA